VVRVRTYKEGDVASMLCMRWAAWCGALASVEAVIHRVLLSTPAERQSWSFSSSFADCFSSVREKCRIASRTSSVARCGTRRTRVIARGCEGNEVRRRQIHQVGLDLAREKQIVHGLSPCALLRRQWLSIALGHAGASWCLGVRVRPPPTSGSATSPSPSSRCRSFSSARVRDGRIIVSPALSDSA
jgi:hypothetical protein